MAGSASPFNQFAQGYDQGQGMAQDFATQRAGNALANGDYQGAAGVLFKSGQLPQGQAAQSLGQAQQDRASAEHKQEIADRAAWLLKAAGAISQIPDDPTHSARKAALQQHVLPVLQQMGADQQTVTALSDPSVDLSDATLTAFGANLQKELQIISNEHGIYGVNKATGQAKTIQTFTPKPMVLPKGGMLVGADDPNAPAAAAPTVDASAPAPATPDVEATWQKIIQKESGGKPGVSGPPTPYGTAQGETQLLPATAHAMAQKLGIPWQPALMTAKTPEAEAYQLKLGRAYYDEGLQIYGGDPAKAASYYYGGPNEKLWGPKTKAYAQAVTTPTPSAPTPALQGGSGKDALAGTGYHVIATNAEPDEKAVVDPNIVKGLIEGRIVPPTQKAAATPYWQAQLQAATQQDPTFDGVNFQARAKTRADFTSGKSAVNITALNTVVGHLDSLDKAIDGLGNYSNFPGSHLNNQLAQGIARASGTDVRVRDFETKKEAVANELTRVFRGTGGAEADIQAWKKQLDSTGSPQALHGVVRAMAELINSRLEALGEQYQQGMGTTKDPLTLLTPDKQKAFKRLSGDSAAPTQAAPKGGKVIRYDAQGNRVQ